MQDRRQVLYFNIEFELYASTQMWQHIKFNFYSSCTKVDFELYASIQIHVLVVEGTMGYNAWGKYEWFS